MKRLSALFVIVLGALTLWAAPALAHGGHHHATPSKTTHVSETHSEPAHPAKTSVTHKDQLPDAGLGVSEAIRHGLSSAPERSDSFVSTAHDDSDSGGLCCCNSGGSLCSPAAAILATPSVSKPFPTPHDLIASINQSGSGRDTLPTLQPPKLIA